MLLREDYKTGYRSMKDLNNEDSSSNSWPPLFYSENSNSNNGITNGQFLNGFLPPGYDKDFVKQTMLQHEAMFKHQVVELHRVYRIQRDMMDDFRRKELQKHVVPLEMSSSSSPVAPRLLFGQKWHRGSLSGREVITSKQTGPFLCRNGDNNSEDCEILDSRPSKVTKRLFDLQLPPDQQYIDSEGENSPTCDLKQGSFRGIGVELADLNEPVVHVEDGTVTGVVNFNEWSSSGKTISKSSPFFIHSQIENRDENKGKRTDWWPHTKEAVKGNPKSLNKTESVPDLFIDSRVSWLTGNPIRKFEPAQASSSSKYCNGFHHGSPSVPKGTTPPGFPSVGQRNCGSNHFDLPDLNKISCDGFLSHEGDGKKPDEEVCRVRAYELPWFKINPVEDQAILSPESKAEPALPLRMIDINVPYDSDSEKITPPKEVDANSRFLIDLNSCLPEDELPLPPLTKRGNPFWIDLEAPPVEEPDDAIVVASDNNLHVEEDNRKTAAEAIVAISTMAAPPSIEKTSWLPLGEDSMEDPLSWFADILASSSAKVSHRSPSASPSPSSSSLDEFEIMTLNLPEQEEIDYMPKPLVPVIDMDEARNMSSITPNRTRRGPGRRGRQRRDFQRDILPGLASLSRQEVSEDIQTLGGLMRATGHQWQSGVTRRNGSGRGRGRRPSSTAAVQVTTTTTTAGPSTDCTQLIQQMSCADDVWGKTPRRPRRQRCPQGNNNPQTATVLLA